MHSWFLVLLLTEDEDSVVRSSAALCIGAALDNLDEDLKSLCVAYIQRRCFAHMTKCYGKKLEYVRVLLDFIHRCDLHFHSVLHPFHCSISACLEDTCIVIIMPSLDSPNSYFVSAAIWTSIVYAVSSAVSSRTDFIGCNLLDLFILIYEAPDKVAVSSLL
jgi:hypothetical protein